MSQSEEIKSKLDIVDIIREYIPLKPAGINFRALCPFHREKTPSFMVSPDKQIWHCFGCSRGGDIFSFVMEIEGVNFVESLRTLASKAGVTLKRQDPKLTSKRNRLLDIMEIAANYYHKVLFDNKQAGKIREYLTKRSLTEETIEEWQIGYSPDSWDDLINLLKGKGFSENEVFLAGLSSKKEGSSRFYNRFRDRIMFPIFDTNGAIVAFSARVNPAYAEASAGKPENENGFKMGKYINSPATMIYDKSRVLFGLDKAKMNIRNNDLAIIVEGQMDVITAQQNGFKNVVAISGTALTVEQIGLLKRYTNNITLAFDADVAGQIAADRGIREAMRAEMNIKVIVMPGYKDPDEYIRDNPDEWRKAVQSAKSIMQYYFDRIFPSLNLDKVEDKRQATKEILPILAKLGDKIEQDFWLRKLSEKIDVEENLLREILYDKYAKERQTRQGTSNAPEISSRPRRSREEMLSELLLALIIKFPNLIGYAINHIQVDQIISLDNKLIYKSLIIYYNNVIDSLASQSEIITDREINYKEFRHWLASQNLPSEGTNDNVQLALLDKLVLLADRDFYDMDIEQAKGEVSKVIITLKKYYLIHRMKEVEKIIAQSEKEGDEEKVHELMGELKMLSDEIREIDI